MNVPHRLCSRPAKVDQGIRHLTECKSAALEYAHAAAGAAAASHDVSAKKFLGLEIPEGQPLERHHYRPHLCLQGAFELLKVGLDDIVLRADIGEAAHWNHRVRSTWIIHFQQPYDSIKTEFFGGGSPKVSGAINDQAF